MLYQETTVITVDEIHFNDGSMGCFFDELLMTTNVGDHITNIEVRMVGEEPMVRAVVMDRTPRSMSDLNIMQQEAALRFLRCEKEAWSCLLDFKCCA